MMIRGAQPTDASALAILLTEAYLGQWTTTPEQVVQELETSSDHSFTLSATLEDEVVSGLNASPFRAAPGGLRIQLYGDPSAFTPLYLEALSRAARLGYRHLLSVVRQDHRPQVEFLSAAGFRNAYQSWGAHLDLQRFDFARFLGAEEKHFLDGTEVMSFTPESLDAPWDALHQLYAQGLRDTPRNPTTTHDSSSAEYFREVIAAGRVFAAVRRGAVLSYTALGLNPASVDSEHTSVDSEHTATRAHARNLGLATLVKATALAWAREQGYATASSGGNVANLAMLRVNTRLGYVPEPMWLTWVRDLPRPQFATSPA